MKKVKQKRFECYNKIAWWPVREHLTNKWLWLCWINVQIDYRPMICLGQKPRKSHYRLP